MAMTPHFGSARVSKAHLLRSRWDMSPQHPLISRKGGMRFILFNSLGVHLCRGRGGGDAHGGFGGLATPRCLPGLLWA